MSNALVDVVIPTIGRPSLATAVDSVLTQTIDARAIVVLDAPDRREAVASLLPRDERVVLVETRGGLGGAGARNVGISAVEAPITAFLDDDDWWDPGSLDARLQTVSGDAPFFVAGAFRHVDRERTSIVPRQPPPYGDVSAVGSYLVQRRDLRFGRSALQSSTILLSSPIARRLRWDEALPKHQDWDFALRVLSDPKVETGWLSEPSVSVVKDSVASVSRRLDWGASLDFLSRHPEIAGRARADFLAVHVLRAALAQRSRRGLNAYVRAGAGIPHSAALVVAGSGLIAGRGGGRK